MLQIARQTDYAARITLHLACLDEDTSATIAEISRARRLPVSFVRRLIGKLVKSGILATVRGAGGGIRLARPASGISLLDLVQAMEGPVAIDRCLDAEHACPFIGECPIHIAWGSASRALVKQLAATRFDALAESPKGHRSAHRHFGRKEAERGPKGHRRNP